MLHRKVRVLIKLVSACLLLSTAYILFATRLGPIPQHESVAVDEVADGNTFQSQYLSDKSTTNLPLKVIQRLMSETNNKQEIHNVDTFGTSPPAAVIVVQVHNRAKYLQELIYSLSQVSGINTTLLIFSHDLYDELVNQVVSDITFARYMRIFYPFPIQLFPDTFPGTDPKDCPRNMSPKKAKQIKCLNADFPDAYGHYREAKFTQTKHHWFWKGNHIVNNLKATSNYSGPYIFLEEDHYVAPDMLYFLRLMSDFRSVKCPDCLLMTLGSYAKSINFARTGANVDIVKWYSSRHNMGLVFDHKAWSSLAGCAESFCTYDDYNWDWSLQHVSAVCLDKPIRAVISTAPRVFHLGQCGVHHKGQDNCYDPQLLAKVQNVLSTSSEFLFPSGVKQANSGHRNSKIPKPNGGWSDKRDHILCLSHLDHSMKPPLYHLIPSS